MSQAIEVKRSTQNGPIKLYATVPSESTPGVAYSVVYIRTKGMERWTCTCMSFAFDAQKKRKHCKHIKQVRALTPGKHGAGSMRQTPTIPLRIDNKGICDLSKDPHVENVAC